MQMPGCVENAAECITNPMDCTCNGVCTVCGKDDCADFDLQVDCINGFAGVTCTCMVDGQQAGNCDESSVMCGLETSCCFQFLPMPL
jgi:hypothetical protein